MMEKDYLHESSLSFRITLILILWKKNPRKSEIHCKPIPVMNTGNTTQGKPCSGPALALYGMAVLRKSSDFK